MKAITDLYPAYKPLDTYSPTVSANGNPDGLEQAALLGVAVTLNAQTVFEIGTFNGATAEALAQLDCVQKVYTLDIPADVQPALPLLAADRLYLNVPHVCIKSNKIVELWGDSATFVYGQYAGQIDLVFVMGANSPEYTANDIAAAQLMVKPGGAVVWHGGTQAVFEAAAKDYEVVLLSERMAVIIGKSEKTVKEKKRKEVNSDG